VGVQNQLELTLRISIFMQEVMLGSRHRDLW